MFFHIHSVLEGSSVFRVLKCFLPKTYDVHIVLECSRLLNAHSHCAAKPQCSGVFAMTGNTGFQSLF